MSHEGSTGSPGAAPSADFPRSPVPMYLGHSTASRSVHTQLRAALGSRTPVLVTGAPGTGKRVIAKILASHAGTPLAELDGAGFDRLDTLPPCAYLRPLESLSPDEQTQLLVRAGDTRLILGTRLQVGTDPWRLRLQPALIKLCAHIRLPPLTARLDDLDVLITQIFVRSRLDKPLAGVSDEALMCLRRYSWPGNVSELEAVLDEASRAAEGIQIELWDLPAHLRLRDAAKLEPGPGTQPLSLAAAERDAVLRALRQARGNKRKAARMLEVGKTTLYRKLALYDVR